MTPDNSAEARAVPVAQADRDAAADLLLVFSDGRENNYIMGVRDGRFDDGRDVQAFAHHRLTFSAEQNTGGMPGREARSLWRGASDEQKNLGWTYAFDEIEAVRDKASERWDEHPTLEVVEAIMRIADERHANALSLAGTGGTGAEGWRDIASAPMKDGAKIIGFCERWGVAERMRNGDKRWVLAAFNGQVIYCEPTLWQPLPTTPGEQS